MGKHPVAEDKITYKPGSGLSATSADGDFALDTRVRAQFLYEVEEAGGELTESIQIRRARLQMQGHAFGKHNEYKMEIAVSPSDMGMKDGQGPVTSPLLDFYFDFDHVRDLSLRVGQYKIPFSRQRVVSSGNLQLVDRSIVNSEFNLDRDLGFDVRSKDLLGLGLFRYYAGIYGGQGRNDNTSNDFGMNYLARVEVLPFGMFDDYEEGDFHREDFHLALAGAVAYVDNAPRNRGILGSVPEDGGTTDVKTASFDLAANWAGFSLRSEWMWRQGDRTPGAAVDDAGAVIPTEDPRDGWGGMVQAGYLIPRSRLEVAARYGLVEPAGTSSLDASTELGGGLSYYFARHPFKLQADYFRLTETPAGGPEEEAHRVRLQLQFGL